MDFDYNIERYKKAKELTSGLLIASALNCIDENLSKNECYEIRNSIESIKRRAKKFEVMRWMEIQHLVDQYNGISGQTLDFKVAAMATAGRLLITISDTKGPGEGKFGGAWISLIGEDGNPGKMGIQGLCATKEEALGLLDSAIEQLPEMRDTNNLSIA
jgi:hypothetical protein